MEVGDEVKRGNSDVGADIDGLGLVEGSECVATRIGADSTVVIVACCLTPGGLLPPRGDAKESNVFFGGSLSARTQYCMQCLIE